MRDFVLTQTNEENVQLSFYLKKYCANEFKINCVNLLHLWITCYPKLDIHNCVFTECGNPSNNGLKSPGYPSNYPNSMNCIYSVEIPAGRAMNINFNYFSLEDASSCG